MCEFSEYHQYDSEQSLSAATGIRTASRNRRIGAGASEDGNARRCDLRYLCEYRWRCAWICGYDATCESNAGVVHGETYFPDYRCGNWICTICTCNVWIHLYTDEADVKPDRG